MKKSKNRLPAESRINVVGLQFITLEVPGGSRISCPFQPVRQFNFRVKRNEKKAFKSFKLKKKEFFYADSNCQTAYLSEVSAPLSFYISYLVITP